MTQPRPETDDLAVRLAMAVRRLRSRLRAEARGSLNELPITQVAILKSLSRDGSATAVQLAASEHISQQAIAQNIAALRARDLVQTAPDPADGRKSLVSLSSAGREMIDGIMASRDAWLVRAIAGTLAPHELGDLARAVDLLDRLADAHTEPSIDIR